MECLLAPSHNKRVINLKIFQPCSNYQLPNCRKLEVVPGIWLWKLNFFNKKEFTGSWKRNPKGLKILVIRFSWFVGFLFQIVGSCKSPWERERAVTTKQKTEIPLEWAACCSLHFDSFFFLSDACILILKAHQYYYSWTTLRDLSTVD